MFLLQYQLRKASMTEVDAFTFLKGDQDEDFITYPAFLEALRQVSFIKNFETEHEVKNPRRSIRFTCSLLLIQVNLIGVPYGLDFQETRDLWVQADIDGNGVVDYEEFKV